MRPVRERAAVDELGDEVLPAVELAGVVDRDDMRVVQGGGGLRFPLEPAPFGLAGELGAQELDRDRTIQPDVEGAIDDAHAALAQH